jgi:hypothetical protein
MGSLKKVWGNQSIKQTNKQTNKQTINIGQAHIQNIINSLDLSRVLWFQATYVIIFNYIIIELTRYNLGLIQRFFPWPQGPTIPIYIYI